MLSGQSDIYFIDLMHFFFFILYSDKIAKTRLAYNLHIYIYTIYLMYIEAC